MGENDNWLIYQDVSKSWRWTRTAPNGRTVAASTQGYSNRADCVANAKRSGYKGN